MAKCHQTPVMRSWPAMLLLPRNSPVRDNRVYSCWIWGSHGSGWEEYGLLFIRLCSSVTAWRFRGRCDLHLQSLSVSQAGIQKKQATLKFEVICYLKHWAFVRLYLCFPINVRIWLTLSLVANILKKAIIYHNTREDVWSWDITELSLRD
jgi:hypothetical protein